MNCLLCLRIYMSKVLDIDTVVDVPEVGYELIRKVESYDCPALVVNGSGDGHLICSIEARITLITAVYDNVSGIE